MSIAGSPGRGAGEKSPPTLSHMGTVFVPLTPAGAMRTGGRGVYLPAAFRRACGSLRFSCDIMCLHTGAATDRCGCLIEADRG